MKRNKRGFTLVELIAVVAILGLIALIVYPAIGSVIRNSRESTYNDQVAVIESAAKNWSIDNASTLPDNGTVYRLPVNTLLEEGYISDDEVKDPRNSSKNLTGNVEIKYDSSIKQFTYKYVDSSSKSSEVSVNNLSTTIINNSKKKDVLVANDGIYKGDNPDNYLKLDGKLWRILSNNSDGSIKIVSNEQTAQISWDNEGNTNFDDSTVKTYLNSTFYNSLNSVEEFKSSDFCLAYNDDECINSENITVGLLTTEDYLNASNNLKCIAGNEAECTVGNYLSDFSETNGPEYTLNSLNGNIYVINQGLISTVNSNATLNVRPVLTVDENVKIVGGTGLETNPYVVSSI